MANESNGVDLAARVLPSDSTLHRELDEEIVLLQLDSEMYFGLDAVGAAMWRALTTTDTVGAALDKLLDEFDVERGPLQDDLLALVSDLIEKGLLRLQ